MTPVEGHSSAGPARTVLCFVLRLVLAAAVLLVGGLLIYAFGAGYFSQFGVGVPTPFNVVATLVLGAALLSVVARILRGRGRKKT